MLWSIRNDISDVLDVNFELFNKTGHASYHMTDSSRAIGFCWFLLGLSETHRCFLMFYEVSDTLNFLLDLSCKSKRLPKQCSMSNRCSCRLSFIASSTWFERHQMIYNQESSSSSLNLATVSRLRPLFTLDQSLAMKTMFCGRWCRSWILKALLIVFTMPSASWLGRSFRWRNSNVDWNVSGSINKA